MKEEIEEWFTYNEGKLLWRKSPNKNHKVGSEAGRPHPKGYLVVNFAGTQNFVHRVIYTLVTGEDLTGWQIDHINGNRTDNRIENLRKVTSAQNGQNRTVLNGNNKTGYHGIFESGGYFYVSLNKDGVKIRRKRKTLERALELRDKIVREQGFTIPSCEYPEVLFSSKKETPRYSL